MEKHYITCKDIMERYGVSINKAYSIMRAIRACTGNLLGTRRLLPEQVELWEKSITFDPNGGKG